MGVITSEEFFEDAYDFLKDIRDVQEEIRDFFQGDFYDMMQNIGGGSSSIVNKDINVSSNQNEPNISSLSGGLNVGDIISSVNDVDSDKANLVIKLTESISGVGSGVNPEESSRFIGDFTNLVSMLNTLDITDEIVNSYHRLDVSILALVNTAKLLTDSYSSMDVVENTANALMSIIKLTTAVNTVDLKDDVGKNFDNLENSVSTLIDIAKLLTNSKLSVGIIQNSSIALTSVAELTSAINIVDVKEDVNEDCKRLEDSVVSLVKIATILSKANPLMQMSLPAVDILGKMASSLSSSIDIDEDKMDRMEKFPRLMRNLGIGILAFAGGIALSALAIGATIADDTASIVGLAGVIALFSAEAFIIGMGSDMIMKGALTIGIMALAIPIFTLGVALSSLAINEIGAENLLLLAGTIGASALLFGGIGTQMPLILEGALSVAAMGLSLMLFSSPLKAISDATRREGFLWEFPVLLTSIGTVFAAAGLAIELILPGALAVAAMGASLYPLAGGLQAVLEIKNLNVETAIAFGDTVSAIIDGFGGISMIDLLTLPPKLLVFAGMGVALIPLAYGLDLFMSKTASFSQRDASKMRYVIQSVTQAFATAGSTDGMSKLFGFNVGENDVERGVKSTEHLGKTLNTLAVGIGKWRDGKFTDEDMKLVGENVTTVMNTIPAVFASIGLSIRGEKGRIRLGGFLFGVNYENSDVERGIKSTMDMGKNLMNLYNGISAWAKGGTNDISTKIPGITKNISDILTAIPNAFAKVGAASKKGEELFGLIDGEMEDGLELVERMSQPLDALSRTLTSFGKGLDPNAVAKNVMIVMSGVSKSFDLFGAKKIDGMSRIIDQFEDFNDVIKDHFKIIKAMPKNELEAFAKHAELINNLSSDMDVKTIKKNKSWINPYDVNQDDEGGGNTFASIAKARALAEKQAKDKKDKADQAKRSKTTLSQSKLEEKLDALNESMITVAAAVSVMSKFAPLIEFLATTTLKTKEQPWR